MAMAVDKNTASFPLMLMLCPLSDARRLGAKLIIAVEAVAYNNQWRKLPITTSCTGTRYIHA